MANPQTEDGFTKIANTIMEALAKIRISGEARQVLDVIFRQTYGWNKNTVMISLKEFQDRTGLEKPKVCRSLAKLRLLNIITQKDKASNANYGLQKDFELWKPLPKRIIFKDGSRTITIKNIKANIRKRDGNKCFICDHSDRMLSVHHIDYNQGNNDESNLITLCNTCHARTNSNYDYWKDELSKKIIEYLLPKKAIFITQKGNNPLPKKAINAPHYINKSYKERKKYNVDTDPYKLSELLFSLILENNPHSRLHACQNGDKESTIQRWAKDIDLLIRKDRQQSLIVEEVIRFTANDDFWGPNVQSGAKLREKWDTLVAQKNRKGVSNSAASKSNVANEEPIAMLDTSGRPLPKLSSRRTAEGRL